MDLNSVVALFVNSMHENRGRAEAEQRLKQLETEEGFSPLLLQIIDSPDVVPMIKFSVCIYLKNMVYKYWFKFDLNKEPIHYMKLMMKQDGKIDVGFSISDHDKEIVRNNIIQVTCQKERPISTHLALAIHTIIRHDFPNRWPTFVDNVNQFLQSSNTMHCFSALEIIHRLVKNFEYAQRAMIVPAMKVLLPPMYHVMIKLLPHDSEQSVLMQKLIMKTYFVLNQYTLILDLITNEVFTQWMEILLIVVTKLDPELPHDMDDEEKANKPHWKLKKWATRMLQRIFYRYGSPGSNLKNVYQNFSNWYLETFSASVLEALLQLLTRFRSNQYISAKVMQHTFNYLAHSVTYSHTWKILKPHVYGIIQEVIFPLMCHNDNKEELFKNDPTAYIRQRTDECDESSLPAYAGLTLLTACCKKRKDILRYTMELCVHILSEDRCGEYQKNGALHVVGSLSGMLSMKTDYRDIIELIIVRHVLPSMKSPHAHIRAKACWVLHNFAGSKIKHEPQFQSVVKAIHEQGIPLMVHVLLNDESLPVKFEAAVGLENFTSREYNANDCICGQILAITVQLLNLLRLTENEDLTGVMQKFFCAYSQRLLPVAADIVDDLCRSFLSVFEEAQRSDEKSIASMAILNTIDTVQCFSMNNNTISQLLQPKVLFVVSEIFKSNSQDFFEEAFALIYNMTTKYISPQLWPLLGDIYNIFQNNGQEYFTEMMPTLHNYITVDTAAFLSNQQYLMGVYEMCRVILLGDYGDELESHAAKLLEVVILQCKGQIDHAIPSILQVAFTKLVCQNNNSELRVMCLAIIVASLYYNSELFLNIMQEFPSLPGMDVRPMPYFVNLWLSDTDCFLGIHDRKLSIIGLCTMLHLELNNHSLFNNHLKRVLPSLVMLFDGLKRNRETSLEENITVRPYNTNEEAYSSGEDDDNDVNETAGKDTLCNYVENVLGIDSDEENDDMESGCDDESNEEFMTALEGYETMIDKDDAIDVHLMFKEVFAKIIESQDPKFKVVLESLTGNVKSSIQDILLFHDKKSNQMS